MSRGALRPPVLLVVVLAAGLAIGAGTAIGLFPPAAVDGLTRPGVLRTGESVTSIPVTMQEYDDPQSVEVTVTIDESLMLRVLRGGTVTKWDCEPGAAFESGKSGVAIDGVNLLNISTTVPLWRDLSAGTTGSDVRSLEDELVRLGLRVSPDGTLSADDLKVIAELAKGAGVQIDGRVPRDLLVWLPRGSTRIDACTTTLGSGVAGGEPIAKASPEIAVAPVHSPTGSLPGARNLELFGDPIPLSESGTLPEDTDPDLIRATPEFVEAITGTPDASSIALRGTTVLRAPVSVAAVPASSVLVAEEGDACVFSAAAAHSVTVVGSEFGSAFVLFAEEAPDRVDLELPAQGAACG